MGGGPAELSICMSGNSDEDSPDLGEVAKPHTWLRVSFPAEGGAQDGVGCGVDTMDICKRRRWWSREFTLSK